MKIVLQNRNGRCVHLGSQRRCCDTLYICRESPGTDCILSGSPIPPLRSCQTCEFYSPQPVDPVSDTQQTELKNE